MHRRTHTPAPVPRAGVHRFRDRVAAHLNDGSTTYLHPDDAEQFARTLLACAESVRSESFQESQFGTVDIVLQNGGRM